MPYQKVFVGNLSFKIKAEELAAEFSIAGTVISANIITRGPRSLGYGFVEMSSEEEAQKAVTLLNKKSVDQREINVELAKTRSEKENRPQGEKRSFRGRGRGFRGRGGSRGPFADKNANNQSDNNNQGNNIVNANNNQSGQNNPQGERNRRPYRSRFPRGGRGGNIQEGGSRDNNQGQPRRPRRYPNRSNRDFSNRTPSPTTLFVANLPYALEDEALLKLFKDHNVSKAHVVMNRNGRSKGFGFVEFENEKDQIAALTASEKLVVDNRDLIVKIALTAPEHSKEGSASSGSPASSAPAPSNASQPTSKTDNKSS